MIKQHLSFATLIEANRIRQKEWDPAAAISLSYRGNELAGEVGEACNVIKKLDREKLGIRGSRDTVEHLAEELADVIICVVLIAIAMNIDLEHIIAAKFNATSVENNLKTMIGAGDVVFNGEENDQ
jgi:NTP pyrophosphatase (non-canonical NTP hydrolase)